MTTSRNDKLSEELARNLGTVTALMQDLLGDIKDNATSLAVLQAKLESLGSSVESLSHVVRNGNGKGAIITRLALAEKSLEDVEESFDELKDEMVNTIKEVKEEIKGEKEENVDTTKFKREKMLSRLKILAVTLPGLTALVIMLIKTFTG